MNFNEQQNRRRTYGSTRRRGSSSSYATGDNRTRGPNIRGSSTGNRQTSKERPMQGTYATGRLYSRNRSHASQGRNNPSDSDRRDNPETLSGGNDTQAGHSRDATSMAICTSGRMLHRCLYDAPGVIFFNIMTGRTVNEHSAPSGCSKQRANQRGRRVVWNAKAFRIPVISFLTQLRPKIHELGRVGDSRSRHFLSGT